MAVVDKWHLAESGGRGRAGRPPGAHGGVGRWGRIYQKGGGLPGGGGEKRAGNIETTAEWFTVAADENGAVVFREGKLTKPNELVCIKRWTCRYD